MCISGNICFVISKACVHTKLWFYLMTKWTAHEHISVAKSDMHELFPPNFKIAIAQLPETTVCVF